MSNNTVLMRIKSHSPYPKVLSKARIYLSADLNTAFFASPAIIV